MTTTPANLPHRLDRTLLIQARRETVFRSFTDPVRWALWWGDGSTIDSVRSRVSTTYRRSSTPRSGSCRASDWNATALSASATASPSPTGARGLRMARSARGTNVFVFNSDGHITSVTGLWSQHPHK